MVLEHSYSSSPPALQAVVFPFRLFPFFTKAVFRHSFAVQVIFLFHFHSLSPIRPLVPYWLGARPSLRTQTRIVQLGILLFGNADELHKERPVFGVVVEIDEFLIRVPYHSADRRFADISSGSALRGWASFFEEYLTALCQLSLLRKKVALCLVSNSYAS